MTRLLVFGGAGAIGGAVVAQAIARGWDVTATTRGVIPAETGEIQWLRLDPSAPECASTLEGAGTMDAVCWAQGVNLSDSLADFDEGRHLELYRANCLAVIVAAAALVRLGLLAETGARLVVVSSIWQERARQSKLSYSMTKAALGGLVRAASVDLGAGGHLINAVLPGVLDTPMTAANLSLKQLDVIRSKTSFGRLPDLGTLVETILFLCSAANRSVTGQSLAVDLGMSNASLV